MRLTTVLLGITLNSNSSTNAITANKKTKQQNKKPSFSGFLWENKEEKRNHILSFKKKNPIPQIQKNLHGWKKIKPIYLENVLTILNIYQVKKEMINTIILKAKK